MKRECNLAQLFQSGTNKELAAALIRSPFFACQATCHFHGGSFSSARRITERSLELSSSIFLFLGMSTLACSDMETIFMPLNGCAHIAFGIVPPRR